MNPEMWSIFGFGKLPWDKLGINTAAVSLAVSKNWFENMKAAVPSLDEKRFGVFVWNTLAFFMSVVLSEVMLKKKASTKAEFDAFYRELGKAISSFGAKHPEVLAYLLFPTDDAFKKDTLAFYRGSFSDEFVASVRQHAKRYQFNVPDESGFAMATVGLVSRLIDFGDVEKIDVSNAEQGAVVFLFSLFDNAFQTFVDDTRKLL